MNKTKVFELFNLQKLSRTQPSTVMAIDRLSSLPLELLTKIMSLLSTKEACCTSVLSKKWEFLYLGLTTVDLSNEQAKDAFYKIVSNLGSNRVLTRCSLQVLASGFKLPLIEGLISTLISQNALQYLSLRMSPRFYLIRSIVNCKTLVHINLEGLCIDTEVDSHVLPSLNKLFLTNVRFYTISTLLSFISVSSCLQELVLMNPDILNSSCDFEMGHFLMLKKAVLSLPWRLLKLLISHFPKLLTLEIHLEDGQEDSVYGWVDPLIVPSCLSFELETCMLIGFRGRRSEIKLAQYIFKHAKEMKIMKISGLTKEDTMIKIDLIMYPKGSPTCHLSID